VNPLALLALKFLVGKGGAIIQEFAASVKRFKALSPTDAAIQALPDDAAAIEAFARSVQAGQAENAAIQGRLRRRIQSEG